MVQGQTAVLERSPDALSAPALIVILHGLGDTAMGWVPEAQELRRDGRFAHCTIVVPTAPTRRITLNGGYPMPGWYDIQSLDPADRHKDPVHGLEESMATVRGLIEAEMAQGVDASRVVLMGFSQGAALSLSTAYRLPFRIAGVVALSGYLPRPEASVVDFAARPRARETPLFMAHGDSDMVVPYAYGEISATLLRSAGISVDWHSYPGLPHSTSDQEMRDVREFLHSVLP